MKGTVVAFGLTKLYTKDNIYIYTQLSVLLIGQIEVEGCARRGGGNSWSHLVHTILYTFGQNRNDDIYILLEYITASTFSLELLDLLIGDRTVNTLTSLTIKYQFCSLTLLFLFYNKRLC